MDVDDTESNEPGECEADSYTEGVDQPDIIGGKDCSQAEEDDDGEIKSESGDSSSEASSEAVENAASPDAEKVADGSDHVLISHKKQDIAKELHEKQTVDFNEDVENKASEKKTEVPEGEEVYFDDDDDRSQTPLQDEPDAGSDYSRSGGVEDNESIEDVKALSVTNVCSNENQQRPESDGLADKNLPNIPDTTLSGRVVPSEVSRKQSVRDDLGELDYEEDENQDEDSGNSVADSSGEEPGEGSLIKKASKKDLKKKNKLLKEEDSEKEEGEESEEEEKDDEHSTDGELDDDDDCEDGEIKEPGQKKPFVRPICRFYMRGNCTWGHSCRFLHPGVNDKGNYAMIDQSTFPMPGPPPPGMMIPPPMGMPGGRGHLPPPPGPWMHEVPPRRLPRGPMEMGPPVVEPEHPTPAPEASNESAWERGLRHAKEIRKKRKETDDDKKPGSPKEERVTSPLPAPARELPAHLPPPREAFFEELPPPGPVLPVFDEDFYGRPVLPPPPEAWPFRPPFDPYDPRWGRGLPLEYPHPPHFMPPPPPDFRIPERDRGHRFSPPPRFDGRRDPRFNPWFDRFHPDGPGRDQAHPISSGDVPAPSVRGRGEEWKDPWLRSRSPKRKQNSSSRSVSRGRRRYRSRTKGSFSSVSSSSYSSNSRSRSGSSSSYTSYSKSSYSRSSYSSRSSSASRSRSRSGRKPLPATTLGQSLLEKRKIHSEVHRPSSSNTTTNELAIGSGPLPARAPPEKKPQQAVPTQSQTKSIAPRPVAPPSVQEMTKPAVSVALPAAGNALSSTKSLPKLSQPIPLSGRTALQPVGREVAAAFTDHEETWNDPNSVGKGGETSNLQPSSPLADSTDSQKEKLGSGRERSGALSGGTEKDAGSVPLRDIPGTRIADKSGMLETGSRSDKTDNKGNSSRDYQTSGRQQNVQAIEKARSAHQVTVKDGGPFAKQPSNRANHTKDHVDRSKLEVGRNAMGRGRRLSNNSARSMSAESKRSLSSLSSSSSEHLYDDIASPISSTSSLSPNESMTKGGKSISVPNQSAVPKLKRPPSPRKLRPKTPPLQQPYPPIAAHKMDKPRSNSQREGNSRAEPRESTRSDRRGEAPRQGTRDGAAMPHRATSHRTDSQRQPPPRGFPPDHAVRDIRRDPGGARERDSAQHAPPGMLPSQHRESASRRAAGMPGSHGPGTRVSDDARLRSSSGARNALPPPPRPSEGSMSFRAGLDARMMSSNTKAETKAVSKTDRVTGVPAHSSSRKRSAEHGSEMPSTKHMRHASDVRYPVKVPVPRKPLAVSPNRSGGRSSGTSTTVALKSPVKIPPPVPPPKLPVQPPSSASNSASSVAKPRKSTSSRREELLMQLKAVEDAIAKKRSKLQ